MEYPNPDKILNSFRHHILDLHRRNPAVKLKRNIHVIKRRVFSIYIYIYSLIHGVSSIRQQTQSAKNHLALSVTPSTQQFPRMKGAHRSALRVAASALLKVLLGFFLFFRRTCRFLPSCCSYHSFHPNSSIS